MDTTSTCDLVVSFESAPTANEYETDDSHEQDELEAGEASEGTIIVDIEEIKDDY